MYCRILKGFWKYLETIGRTIIRLEQGTKIPETLHRSPSALCPQLKPRWISLVAEGMGFHPRLLPYGEESAQKRGSQFSNLFHQSLQQQHIPTRDWIAEIGRLCTESKKAAVKYINSWQSRKFGNHPEIPRQFWNYSSKIFLRELPSLIYAYYCCSYLVSPPSEWLGE